MAVDFANGGSTFLTKPPRTIITYDTVSGCPPTRGANVPIASATITLTASAALVIDAKIIRNNAINSGRCDMSLYVSTGQVCRTLDYIDAATDWQQHCLAWMGTLAAGTHTIYMYSDNCANCWGCTSYWGHIQVMIFE